MASGGLKNMRSYEVNSPNNTDHITTNWAWYGVVTAICIIGLLAVAADAIVRHRIFVIRDRNTVDDRCTGQSSAAKVDLSRLGVV